MSKNHLPTFLEGSFKRIDQILSIYYPERIPDEHRDLKMDIVQQLSPTVVFVLNFPPRSYLHVSENIYEMLGITSQQLISKGLILGIQSIEEEDRAVFNTEILPTAMQLYQKFALAGRNVCDTKLTYNLKMIDKEGKIFSSIHILKPISVNEEGFPMLVAKYIVHDLIGKTPSYPEMKFEQRNVDGKYEVLFTKSFLIKPDKSNVLSSREQQILQLIKEGHSSQEIADKLFISLYTVNNHRRSLVKKCGVKNLALAELPS